jgi:hypothetical protein
LKGRKGNFVLQHSATMTRGEGQLTITVVPDSGTEELQGLSGKLSIKIETANTITSSTTRFREKLESSAAGHLWISLI